MQTRKSREPLPANADARSCGRECDFADDGGETLEVELHRLDALARDTQLLQRKSNTGMRAMRRPPMRAGRAVFSSPIGLQHKMGSDRPAVAKRGRLKQL